MRLLDGCPNGWVPWSQLPWPHRRGDGPDIADRWARQTESPGGVARMVWAEDVLRNPRRPHSAATVAVHSLPGRSDFGRRPTARKAAVPCGTVELRPRSLRSRRTSPAEPGTARASVGLYLPCPGRPGRWSGQRRQTEVKVTRVRLVRHIPMPRFVGDELSRVMCAQRRFGA